MADADTDVEGAYEEGAAAALAGAPAPSPVRRAALAQAVELVVSQSCPEETFEARVLYETELSEVVVTLRILAGEGGAILCGWSAPQQWPRVQFLPFLVPGGRTDSRPFPLWVSVPNVRRFNKTVAPVLLQGGGPLEWEITAIDLFSSRDPFAPVCTLYTSSVVEDDLGEEDE